jgi:hypothetical protein
MKKFLLCVVVIAAVVCIVRPWPFSRDDTEKPTAPLDYSKPIYTIDRAIVCPLGQLVASYYDVRADHGPEAIVALYTSLFGRESREKALGCEEWRGGVKVEAVELERKPEGLVLVQINGTLFTAKAHLTNNPNQ